MHPFKMIVVLKMLFTLHNRYLINVCSICKLGEGAVLLTPSDPANTIQNIKIMNFVSLHFLCSTVCSATK